MFQSIIQTRGLVPFPDFQAERIYMAPFTKAVGLPKQYARWQPSVDAMLAGIETDQTIYLMVDQSKVMAGSHHRRPGLHLDGYWIPSHGKHGGHRGIGAHGGSGGGHGGSGWAPPRHWGRPAPGGHGSNRGGHGSSLPEEPGSHRPGPRHSAGASGWDLIDFTAKEAIVLASNVQACRAFSGVFSGRIGDGGDCESIDRSSLLEVPMEAGRVYAGNVCMVHESLPVQVDCLRTVIRLNVPGWSP